MIINPMKNRSHYVSFAWTSRFLFLPFLLFFFLFLLRLSVSIISSGQTLNFLLFLTVTLEPLLSSPNFNNLSSLYPSIPCAPPPPDDKNIPVLPAFKIKVMVTFSILWKQKRNNFVRLVYAIFHNATFDFKLRANFFREPHTRTETHENEIERKIRQRYIKSGTNL